MQEEAGIRIGSLPMEGRVSQDPKNDVLQHAEAGVRDSFLGLSTCCRVVSGALRSGSRTPEALCPPAPC